MTYTEGFKSNMIRKMARPNGISASALAKESGVPNSLCRAGFATQMSLMNLITPQSLTNQEEQCP